MIYVDMAMRFRLGMVIAIVAIIGSTTLSHPPSPLRPKKTNSEDQINTKETRNFQNSLYSWWQIQNENTQVMI